MNGMIKPEIPITRKEMNITTIVDMERSSSARMRAKSVSLRSWNVIATDVPCARKNVIDPNMCMNINQGTRASISSSRRLKDGSLYDKECLVSILCPSMFSNHQHYLRRD